MNPSEGLAKVIAAELTRSGFFGWLMASGDSALWASRSPEKEIGRVAALAASDWLAEYTAKERAEAWDEGWQRCSDWWHACAAGESHSVDAANPYRIDGGAR